MALLLNRSGKQMVRLSSGASPSPLRVLTSVSNNNCFSSAADSSSPGGMNQELKPKEDAALKYLLDNCSAYFAKNMANVIQKKPVPSGDDFRKFLDDLYKKLPPVDDETKDPASETDQAEKNPKAFTPEMVKATSVFADTVTGGILKYVKPDFKVKGDKFNFTLDTNGLYLTVNVSGLAKEHLVVWVSRDRVLVASTDEVAPDQKVREAITLPSNLNYDPDDVSGTIIEDGQLKISFPVSKEGGKENEEKYFDVNLV